MVLPTKDGDGILYFPTLLRLILDQERPSHKGSFVAR